MGEGERNLGSILEGMMEGLEVGNLTLLYMLFNNCAIGYMSCQRNETAIMHLEIYFISLTWIILSHKTSVSSDALARSKCLK